MSAFSLLTLPFRLIRRFATFFVVLALIASLGFNVAMFTISGVYAAAQGALSAVGIGTVVAREAGEKIARQNAARKISRETAKKVTQRVQRGAVRNIGSVFGEAVPFLGVSVIAGALVWEVKDACDTAADMEGLEAALTTDGDPEAAREQAVMNFDCGSILPSYDDLPGKEDILATVLSSSKEALATSSSYYRDLVATDWSAEYLAAKIRFSDWIAANLSDLSEDQADQGEGAKP